MENPEKENITKVIWTILFALMYPVLITFSLLFTGILWFFSLLSRVLSKIIQLFSRTSNSEQPVE